VIDLYSIPGSAALAPHMALEEAGAEYRLVRVERDETGEVVHPPGYRELNPHGRVPTARFGDQVLYESAAIVMHVSDSYPAAGLAPQPGTAERADWYRWLCHLTNTVQPRFLMCFYPQRYAHPAGHDAVKAKAVEDLLASRDWLDGLLAGGPYLLGERFTSADLFLAMLTRWGRRLEQRWWDAPNLGAHYERIKARPAVRRVYELESLDDSVV
jgi:glutathione S-transferase